MSKPRKVPSPISMDRIPEKEEGPVIMLITHGVLLNEFIVVPKKITLKTASKCNFKLNGQNFSDAFARILVPHNDTIKHGQYDVYYSGYFIRNVEFENKQIGKDLDIFKRFENLDTKETYFSKFKETFTLHDILHKLESPFTLIIYSCLGMRHKVYYSGCANLLDYEGTTFETDTYKTFDTYRNKKDGTLVTIDDFSDKDIVFTEGVSKKSNTMSKDKFLKEYSHVQLRNIGPQKEYYTLFKSLTFDALKMNLLSKGIKMETEDKIPDYKICVYIALYFLNGREDINRGLRKFLFSSEESGKKIKRDLFDKPRPESILEFAKSFEDYKKNLKDFIEEIIKKYGQ